MIIHYPKSIEEAKKFYYPKEVEEAYAKLPYPPVAKIAEVARFIEETFAPIKWGKEWPVAVQKGGSIKPSDRLYAIYEFTAEQVEKLYVGDITKYYYDDNLKGLRDHVNSKDMMDMCDEMGLYELKKQYQEQAKGSCYLLLFSNDDVVFDNFLEQGLLPLKVHCPLVFFSGLKPPNLHTFLSGGYVKYLIEIGYLKIQVYFSINCR